MTALIWDLDGTLLDSYGVILDSTARALLEAGVTVERRELHRRLIAGSVRTVLQEIGRERGLDAEALWLRVDALNRARNREIALMSGAAEALSRLAEMGIPSFVYTHNSEASRAVLERHGVLSFFTYVLTAEAGLPRKPAPDGIRWLIDRFALDRCQTFYVGDRPIDVRCAANAGVGSILFLPPESPAVPVGTEDYIVSDLREIPGLFEGPHSILRSRSKA